MWQNLRKDKIIGYCSQTKKNIVCMKCTESEESAQCTWHGDHIHLRISVHLILIYSVYQWDNSYNNLNDFFEWCLMSDMFSADILRRRKVQKVPLNVPVVTSNRLVRGALQIENWQPALQKKWKTFVWGPFVICFIKFHSKKWQIYLWPCLPS